MNLNLDITQKSTSISLCMIVKNEQKNLSRCLTSVQPYVDEMVIIDTGSEDETTEIAQKYGAKVEYFEWCDDFAAARNYALSHVSNNWILMLDADEELVVHSKNFRDRLISNQEIIAYQLMLTGPNPSVGTPALYTPRLFRNLPDLRYRYPLHEILHFQNQPIPPNLIRSLDSLKIWHYGQSESELKQEHLNRNIPILERARQEEGLSLLLLYTLAGCYRDTQQTEKAEECYAEAFERLLPHLMSGNPPEQFGFVPSLMFTLGVISLREQDYETVMLLAQRGLEWCPSYPPLNYLAGSTLKALGFPLGSVAYFETCLQLGRDNSYYKGEPFDRRYLTIYPAYDIGCVYMEMKRWESAKSAFQIALSFEDKLPEIEHKLQEITKILADGL